MRLIVKSTNTILVLGENAEAVQMPVDLTSYLSLKEQKSAQSQNLPTGIVDSDKVLTF